MFELLLEIILISFFEKKLQFLIKIKIDIKSKIKF